ncbi:hypothetical protein [Dyella sp. C11]|uniref:hypothetical protein n=1 Tax=Dyella sp. C11 TaxID=2126991 RepID=UPI0013007863|nr:hypothetical protein [Dyella sp. C11]
MGMDHRCLVLSGRLLDGQDPASVHARMAAAFGMEMAGFRERVFARAPLIIRRGLEPEAADAQVAQLRGMGVEADIWPDDERLIWLRRDNQVRGPLPADALDRYAEAGDQWCHDGGQTWFAWEPAASSENPPPLPTPPEAQARELIHEDGPAPRESDVPADHQPPPLPEEVHAYAFDASDTHDPFAAEPEAVASREPPPLPATSTKPPLKKPYSTAAVFAVLFAVLALLWHPLSSVALLVALCTLVYLYQRPALRGRFVAVAAVILSATALVLWMHRPPAAAPVAQPYVPRPLKPLSQSAPATVATTECTVRTAAPKNDEDRFLLTGQRLLTGHAQRKGDTYVAEAAVSVDAQCQPNALQLYVFHNGVFIGTVLDTAASVATTKLSDFDLVDDQHLRVTLAQCSDKPASCAATTVRQFAVMPGGGGWTLGETK